MNPNDPNVAMMELVAHRLGPELREALVFVGGAVGGLLVTDPANPAIRPTEDVDLIVHATVRADFQRVEEMLRGQGFLNDMRSGAPICRWKIGAVTVDVMPTLDEILGFSNRWYPLALETAAPTVLPSEIGIRVVTAPVFLGTKFEAFAQRGKNDYLFSHDLGDLIAVVDGRTELLAECLVSPEPLRAYLSDGFSRLLATSAFLEALPGHLPGDAGSQARLPDLLDTLQRLAALR